MDIRLLGEQISKYRKALDLTQEELGKRVGVSTQAVSRWENGGAPDVSLLPAIADTLHVTVDALFGREGGETQDMEGTLLRWMKSLPRGKLWPEMATMLARSFFSASYPEGTLPKFDGPESCLAVHGGKEYLMRTGVMSDEGFLLASFAKDMQFFALYPEPEAGYQAFFAGVDAYRSLFTALAEPDTLELLLAIYAEPLHGFTAAAMAKRLSLPEEAAQKALSTLYTAGLLDRRTVELEDGPSYAYLIRQDNPLIPFLLNARYLLEDMSVNYVMIGPRSRPWLRKEAADREKN